MKKLACSALQILCAAVLAGVPSARGQSTQALSRSARATLSRQLHDSIRAVLTAGVEAKAFPGAYAVIGDSRGVLAEGGAGHLDWAKSSAPTAHTLWDVASLTKVIGTTTALAQLIESGKVDVNAPVQRYLPNWVGAGKESVTVRHLLTHTSGLPSFKPYDRDTHNADSMSVMLFNTQLERAPGERMVYSDIGAFMMGQIVEHVSGEKLDAYLAKHVFAPLKMRETMFNPSKKLWPRVAPTEFDSTRGGLMHGKVHDERAYYLGGVAAHAGIFSSAADITRFVEMLMHGGALDRKRVLKPETIALFTAYADSGKHNRALGWQKSPAAWSGKLVSSRSFGHTGFTGTSILIDPVNDVFVILLSNRVNPTRDNPRIGDVRSRIADAALGTVRTAHGLPITAGAP